MILSHFHGDHIGGLVTPERAQAFPNAEIRVPLVEFNYWLDDANMNKAAEGSGLRNGHNNVRRVFGAIPGKYRHEVRMGQARSPRHHRGRHTRSHAGPYGFPDRVGQS